MEEALRQLGLSDGETTLYLLLLKTPHQTAQALASVSGIKRTNVYRLLDSLSARGLVMPNDSPVKQYRLIEPQALQNILIDKQRELKQISSSLSAAMPAFRSQYSLSLDKPGVVHMAGNDGFERLLEDMAHSQTEVLLVASNDQPNDVSTLRLFEELIMKRKANGVRTRALFHDGDHRVKIKEKFIDRGYEVRFIGNTPFTGEVVLYENNTAFTVYDPSLITTVVTNTHIAGTMRTLFEELWTQADIY